MRQILVLGRAVEGCEEIADEVKGCSTPLGFYYIHSLVFSSRPLGLIREFSLGATKNF